MATRSSAIYSPARRGLPMTYAYTRPLPRIFSAPNTAPLNPSDRLMVSPLRSVVQAAKAVKGFFKA